MSVGEPIAAGQGGRGELDVRFGAGFELGKVNKLLQEARERAGSPGETISTLNLVAVYFTEGAYERARPALDHAGVAPGARPGTHAAIRGRGAPGRREWRGG